MMNIYKGGVFEKKTWNFKVAKVGRFAAECVSNDIISEKCLFRPVYDIFQQDIREIFDVGKLIKFDEEAVFFREKLFSCF